MTDIIAKLRAHCSGHPAAHIAWPHRLLHEAADALEAAHAALGDAHAALALVAKDSIYVNPFHAFSKVEIPNSTFRACGEARQRIEDTVSFYTDKGESA